MSLPYTRSARKTGADEYYTMPVGTSAATALTTGRQYFVPVRIDSVCGIKKLGVEPTATAATAIGRVSVYKDAGLAYPRPGELIKETAATIDLSAAGFIEGTFTSNASITKPGIYWLSLVNQTAAATVRTSSLVENGGVALQFGTTKPAAASVIGSLYLASITGAVADVSVSATLVPSAFSPWFYYVID